MKRINTVLDCVLITQLCCVVSAVLTYVAHRVDLAIVAGAQVSSFFVGLPLVAACLFMFVPYAVWSDRLKNQCADDEQQAVLDITETIRVGEHPENWSAMWRSIKSRLRSMRKPRACDCYKLGVTAEKECDLLGCPERGTGIYSLN